MLARGTFDSDYVSGCRSRFRQMLDEYETVPGPAPALGAAIVLSLDQLFVHRQRGREVTDGACKTVRTEAERLAVDPSGEPPAPAELRRLGDAFFAEIESRFA